jgi:hypothetical protein
MKLQGTIIREDDADSDCEGADEVVLFASQLSSLTIDEVETPPQKGGAQTIEELRESAAEAERLVATLERQQGELVFDRMANRHDQQQAVNSLAAWSGPAGKRLHEGVTCEARGLKRQRIGPPASMGDLNAGHGRAQTLSQRGAQNAQALATARARVDTLRASIAQMTGEQDGGQADDEYTQEMIDGMSREEFNRRRHWHAMYGKVEGEEAEEEPNVVATGYVPFNGAEDRLVHLENATPGTFPAHPLMGDTEFPQIAELAAAGNALPVATEEQNPMHTEPVPDDPRRAHAWRRFQITHRDEVVNHDTYHAFHQNQHDTLERLGWNRVRAMRARRDNMQLTGQQLALIAGVDRRPTLEGPIHDPSWRRRRLCDTDDADAGQAGSGLAHHVGASAEQQVLAGTGQIPPAPGYHRMPTGEIMADGQLGGWMPAFAKNDPGRAGDNPAPYWYMGAGNPMDGQVPSNKADEIAMDHDYEYGAATSFADVRRADDKFVERMRHQPGIWPAVAAFAIHTKGSLEAGLELTMGDRIYPNAAMLAENAKMASLPHPTVDNLRAASMATPETRAPLRYVGPLTATVVWGQGLSQLRRLEQLIGPTGDVSTAQIAAQIRRGDGFYGGTRREISAAIAAHTSFRGQEQLYLVSSQLDEQWGYISLLSVSRKLARRFLKVCYTRHERGLSYGSALELVARAKPERPVDNAIDLLAHFLSQA